MPVRVVPWDGPAEEVESVEPVNGISRPNAMRSWLVSGVHLFLVDPRRRFGSHGRTRELLVVEQPVRHDASERWQTLAAALHRHTVRDGLDRLSAAERRIITLAYLEGRTNREIASMLGVSVSTVRRRLQVALEHLDIFLRRTGAWLAALALAALAYLNGQMARGARWANSPVGDRAHLVAATLTLGALGVAVVGFVALPKHAAPNAGSATAISPNFHVTTGVPSLPSGPLTVAANVVPDTAAGVIVATKAGSNGGGPSTSGCQGNPTNAPPPLPVASHDHHPTGPPVTHPGPGGC
jgi:DNA-binding Lrp family transcriptional regulator